MKMRALVRVVLAHEFEVDVPEAQVDEQTGRRGTTVQVMTNEDAVLEARGKAGPIAEVAVRDLLKDRDLVDVIVEEVAEV